MSINFYFFYFSILVTMSKTALLTSVKSLNATLNQHVTMFTSPRQRHTLNNKKKTQNDKLYDTAFKKC